jgi:hypothetical protein
MRPRDLEDAEIADGQSVYCPMMLQDGYKFSQERVSVTDAERRMIRDARAAYLKTAAPLSGHRPGYAKDILDAQMFEDALACGLAGAITARDASHASQYERQLWRGGPAVVAVSDKVPDPDENNGGNGDDEDESEESGEDDDGDDGTELERAQKARDQSYADRDARQRDAWKDMGGTLYSARPLQPLDPSAADRTQALGFRTRGGR